VRLVSAGGETSSCPAVPFGGVDARGGRSRTSLGANIRIQRTTTAPSTIGPLLRGIMTLAVDMPLRADALARYECRGLDEKNMDAEPSFIQQPARCQVDVVDGAGAPLRNHASFHRDPRPRIAMVSPEANGICRTRDVRPMARARPRIDDGRGPVRRVCGSRRTCRTGSPPTERRKRARDRRPCGGSHHVTHWAGDGRLPKFKRRLTSPRTLAFPFRTIPFRVPRGDGGGDASRLTNVPRGRRTSTVRMTNSTYIARLT